MSRRAGPVIRAALLAAPVLGVGAPFAAAVSAVRPALGRWEGRAGSARVVFTVETASSQRRFVVRPVMYCAPDRSTNRETGLFSLFQPDAWPIAASGDVKNAPLTGRFDRSRASLEISASSSCARRGTRFAAAPMLAVPIVADGSFNVSLAPHERGLIGETTQFATRGEGALVDSTC